MSRPLRIEYPGAWYHVMNRGRRGEEIFFTDADRREFILVLREAVELWNFRIAAYCLMPNHYHLLIQTPDGNLSRGMRHINGVYTQRFNRRHKMEGQLFRGRYKAVLVEEDGHLLEVLRYIHRNPLRAGMVKDLGQYPWSSHHGYLSWAKSWSWLHKDELLAMLSPVKKRHRSAYRDFVSRSEPEEIERFYSLKNLPSLLGSADFKDFIRERFSSLLDNEEIPEARSLSLTAEEVIAAVCGFYRVSREELLASRRGVEKLPRDVAVYLVRHLCRMSLSRVGMEFGVKNYSTVSSVIQRVKARAEREGRLAKEIAEIRNGLLKGQRQT